MIISVVIHAITIIMAHHQEIMDQDHVAVEISVTMVLEMGTMDHQAVDLLQ